MIPLLWISSVNITNAFNCEKLLTQPSRRPSTAWRSAWLHMSFKDTPHQTSTDWPEKETEKVENQRQRGNDLWPSSEKPFLSRGYWEPIYLYSCRLSPERNSDSLFLLLPNHIGWHPRSLNGSAQLSFRFLSLLTETCMREEFISDLFTVVWPPLIWQVQIVPLELDILPLYKFKNQSKLIRYKLL